MDFRLSGRTRQVGLKTFKRNFKRIQVILVKRKDATQYRIELDDGKLVKNDTIITKSFHNENPGYFLIDEFDEGTILLGTKYMITQMYHSKKIIADSTFRIAPKGFTQVYIIWFIVEGVQGAEAFPAVFI